MEQINLSKLITRLLSMLSLAGLMFSGYLSAIKLFTNTCALGEACPYFLGYPACWYGFVMYLALFIVTLTAIVGSFSVKKAFRATMGISFLGFLFSGNFLVQEFMNSAITGRLGLSTCAYGFIFFTAILILSIVAVRKVK